MTEPASWAVIGSDIADNSNARLDPEEGGSYTVPVGMGLATLRNSGVKMPDKEPLAVWFLVIGSIAFLILLAKTFKTAKA